ncbi:MAG TPA: SDR family oxidoreductase [Gammaproteobacteria bacterium]|nr:SDR family oxidoreductase [Gammaproteobacteria bacterium]
MNSAVHPLFRLDSRVAVVTGAYGKLGPVWTRALLDAGAVVLGLDRPGAGPAANWHEMERTYGRDRLLFFAADVRDRAALQDVCRRCCDALGRVDVLVNNAGIDQPPGEVKTHRLQDIPQRQFEDVFAVNVGAAFQTAQIFGAQMVEQGGGSIVNIGSLYAGVSPDARYYDHLSCDPPFLKPPAYGASKAALINLTKYLATHWARDGVRVNALSPGGVSGGQDEQFKAKFTARVPLGRMAEERDLIGPLLFLASDASAYVTGTELKVDGGYTAW